MGKTSLVWTFAKREMVADQSLICLKASFKNLSDLEESLVKQNAVRLLCELFPAIIEAISHSPDPLHFLTENIRGIVRSKNLLIILDNIDTLLGEKCSGVLNDIISNLLVSGIDKIRVVCTTRDESFQSEVNQFEFELHELKGLAEEDCKQLVNKEKPNDIDSNLLQKIIQFSGGAPKVLDILTSIAATSAI